MATAMAKATLGSSRHTTTEAAEGSHVERTGGTSRRHHGSGCTITVIVDMAAVTVTVEVVATMTAAAANNDNINKDDNDNNNINDNEDKDDGRPGNDGRREVEEDMVIMVSPQAGKTNDDGGPRLPINA